MGMACSGTLYGFGAYADTIKEVLELKQSGVELIGYLGDAAAYMTGPLLGLTVDWFGSATMGCIATLLISLGYLLMGLVMSRHQSFSKGGALFVVTSGFGLVCAGSALFYIALISAVLKAVRVRPEYKGKVVGILASSFGLSAFLFVSLLGLLEHNVTVFFYTTSLIIFIVGTTAASLVHHLLDFGRDYSPASVTDQRAARETRSGPSSVRAHGNGAHQAAVSVLDAPGDQEALMPDARCRIQSHEGAEGTSLPSTRREIFQVPIPFRLLACRRLPATSRIEYKDRLKEAVSALNALLQTGLFWLFLSYFLVCAGVGLMTINNLGSLAKSRTSDGEADSRKTQLVQLFSLLNCGGRFMTVPRAFYLYLACASFGTGSLLISLLGGLPILYASVVVLGTSYGMLFSIMPILVSEDFDANHFGLNWGWITVAPPIGGIIFNGIAGAVYDVHAENRECHGKICFSLSYAVRTRGRVGLHGYWARNSANICLSPPCLFQQIAAGATGLLGTVVAGLVHRKHRARQAES
eukprot:scaffold1911_cov397-Prasinococcus_capsulatus_cf.AAC.28